MKEIPNPNFNSGIIDYQYFTNNGNEFLASWNKNENKLEIVEMNSGERVKDIELGFLDSSYHVFKQFFLIPSQDSIFIFADLIHPSRPKTLLLLNFNGNLVSTWNLDSIYRGNHEYAIQPLPNCGMLFKKGKIYLQKINKIYSHSTKEERKKAYSEPTELIIDLSENPPVVENNFGEYPTHYFEGYYMDIFFSRCLNDKNELIYSFKADDYIHVYDENGEMRSYDAHSNYIHNFEAFKEADLMNMELKKRYFTEQPKYTWIKFDSFRKQYIRMAYHRCSYTTQDGILTGYYDIEKSLIFLNSNFERIGEIKLNHNSFSSLIDITKEGLLISTKDSTGLHFGIYNVEE